MKIAAISEDGVSISQHFGRALLYVVVTDVENIEEVVRLYLQGKLLSMTQERFYPF